MKNSINIAMKILKKAATILIFAVLILSVISIGYQRISGNNNPTIFGYGAANILTGSMEPTIPTGSLIIIKDTDKYELDDIVTFIDEAGKPVTHRIINFNQDNKVVTKGDANSGIDKPVSEDRIIGKVILTIPVIGGILGSLQGPQIVVIILAISLLIYFISNIFNRKGEDDNGQEN